MDWYITDTSQYTHSLVAQTRPSQLNYGSQADGCGGNS